MIQVLIVEDRPEIRLGLKMRLAAEPDMAVIGCAGDGIAALDLVEQLAPDVVLMDVEMPLQDGIETTRILQQRHPCLPVVILSIHDDAATRTRARCAQAAGFVSKENSVDCLLNAIRCASQMGASGQPQ